MLPHFFTNFELQKYQNEPKFNGVFSILNYKNIKMNQNLMAFFQEIIYLKQTMGDT